MRMAQPDPKRHEPVFAAAPAAPAAAALGDAFTTKNLLLGFGTACLFGMVHFYKKRQTTPFKACWALMWPTLGGGIMLAVQPDEQQLAKLVPPEELQKRRDANEAIRRMAAAAGGGKGG